MTKPKSKNSKPYVRKGTKHTAKPSASAKSSQPSASANNRPKAASSHDSTKALANNQARATAANDDQIKEPTRTNANHATNTATNTQTRKVDSQPKSAEHSGKSSESQSKGREQGLTPEGKTQSKHNSNMSPDKRHMLIGLIIVGITIIVGVIATLLGGKMDDSYVKPPVYPPEWVFPVAWSIIYISIAIASYLAYIMVADDKKRRGDVIWYGIHLFFNFMWPLFYFTLGWLIFSCVWLGLVIATAIVVTYRFYRANLTSGIIFTIYTLWLIYALYLSLGITILNA